MPLPIGGLQGSAGSAQEALSFWSKPIASANWATGAINKYGTGGEIRTLTLQILSLLSLPLDYTCLVGRGGFEPPTLKGAAGLQPGALPLCHLPLEVGAGIEPALVPESSS